MMLSRTSLACLHCAAMSSSDGGSSADRGIEPTAFAGTGSPIHASAEALTSGIDTAHFDPRVRVQDDFFRHVNGVWLDSTPIPADKARIGAFEHIQDETQAQLRALIDEAAAGVLRADVDVGADVTAVVDSQADARTDNTDHDRDADARKIGTLYAAFMDEPALESLGIHPLAEELAAIDAVSERHQLAPLMARLAQLGVAMPIVGFIRPDARDSTRYVPYLQQEGLGLPDRDYYLLESDARFAAMRAEYVAHLARLLALAGERNAETAARAVLSLETELARAQWSRVDNRDPVRTYNPVVISALPALAPGIEWNGYLAAAGYAGRTADLIVRQPSYVTALAALLASAPLDTWKAYARSRLLGAYAPFLSRAFVEERFAFAGTVLRGTPENLPRWKRATALIDEALGDALGRLYVQRHFPPTHKARMEALVERLMQAYRQSIDQLEWMGPATRREAQAKLERLRPKIGYPARWIDYASLEIRPGDLVGNVMRARRFEHERQIAKLGTPIDRAEWFMTPQTVNAYYNPAMNEIVFPASILKPPFFDAEADDAVNFGAIGAVIGHEISHGFDDQGSQYDGAGNLRDWWSADDRARFDAKTRRLVQQYGAYVPLPGYPLNGELSLGENIADNSGLAIAWKAWRLSLGGRPAPVIDGRSGEERFFFGFAQVWRGKSRDEALIQQIKAGPHAPAEFRANGTVRNHPGFYATFGVEAGDGMYLAPEQRVSIW